MAVHSLSSAAQHALAGIDDAVRQVDEVAHRVAAGVSSAPESSEVDSLGQLARLPGLKNQVAANARVISTTEQMFDALGSLLRK